MARSGRISSASKIHIHAFLLLALVCVGLAQYQAYPQPSAYPAPTAYQAYVPPAVGYPAYPPASYPAYGQQQAYGSYGYNTLRPLVQADVKNCTDIDCGQDECCVITPRASICVKLSVANATDPLSPRVCRRQKLCNSDADCFSPPGCCVYNTYVTADTTCPLPPDYYKYPPNSRPGQIVPPVIGVCAPYATINSTCVASIDPMNVKCPCGAGYSCNATLPGSIIGRCVTATSMG